MSRNYRVAIVDWKQDNELLRGLRQAVFVDEQGISAALEWDDLDITATHAMALDGEGNSIGTARLLPDGHIGRMAVLPAWRGRGVGSELLRCLLNHARRLGHDRVKLSAQDHAMAFYRRHGFVEQGDAYLEAGIPHVAMSREL